MSPMCSPFLSIPTDAPAAPAIARAIQEARSVLGAAHHPPCGFREIGGPAVDGHGTWVLVTCPRAGDAERQAHLRERCLTATQRFTLSLWTDGLPARWTDEGVPDDEVLRRHGVDLNRDVPVGRVWIGTGGTLADPAADGPVG